MNYETILNKEFHSRRMPCTKASKGGDKLEVTITTRTKHSVRNYRDIRFVFHNDKVYMTELEYNTQFRRGKRIKSNCLLVSKRQRPFDILRFGYTYNGEQLDPLALVDMALKLYTDNRCLDTNSDGKLVIATY